MKHIKDKKSYKNKDTNCDIIVRYKIPSYPLNVYLIALTKIGMTEKEIERWSDNPNAQYWNNSGIKHIYLNRVYYNGSSDEYGWSWSLIYGHTTESDIIKEITVGEHEIQANKYNI